MNKIMIVEDDPEIGSLLKSIVTSAAFDALLLTSGDKVLYELASNHYDVILLDLMLPGIQGEELLAQIRQVNQIPVIIISAKSSLETKISMLQFGADDYIQKPFEPQEVVARIVAALRRYHPASDQIVYDDIVIDESAKKVFIRGHEVTLTSKEFSILSLLCTYPAKVFSKANLYESVWNELYAYDDNTLGVHISNLRKKLKEETGKEYIETIWGIGYKIK